MIDKLEAVARVLESWRAQCPHPRVRTGSETKAMYVLWLIGGAFLLAGMPVATGICWAYLLAVHGTPWPPLLPAVRTLRAALTEAEKRR